jgi:exopolyphosphatase / guanosine-5'-triphosphate,3'-diphosphate pyrophosphatase
VRRACIDIGSNTTRLLVAECDGERLLEIYQERAFTRLGRGVVEHGEIPSAKIEEVVEVVVEQLQTARRVGAKEVHGVATAAIRRASNGTALLDAIRGVCGLSIEVLSGEEEARLAFLGVAGTLGHDPSGSLGVVDAGGGSSELVVGTAPDEIGWSTSFGVGSGDLADHYLRSDPPAAEELSAARAHIADALDGIAAPHPAEAVAVGGSAASLRRLAGPLLDGDSFARALSLLAAEPASEISRRFALDIERVRLLPAGLLILEAASELFGQPLQIGRGGVREGVLLEAGR